MNHYYGIVKEWFTSDEEVETIHVRVRRKLDTLNAIENLTGVQYNQMQANQCFCEFYDERRRQAAADAA